MLCIHITPLSRDAAGGRPCFPERPSHVQEAAAITRAGVQDSTRHPPAGENTNLAASAPGDGFFMSPPYRATRPQAAGASPRPSPEEPGLLRGCEPAAAGKRHHLAAARPGLCCQRGRIRPRTRRRRSPRNRGFPHRRPQLLLLRLWGHACPFACRGSHCGAGGGHRQDCKVG